MEPIKLNRPASLPSPRLARLTRHLTARLLDFDPGGPQILWADEERGQISARFPSQDLGQVLADLERLGICVAREGDAALFSLDPDLPFESLDHVWGCLFEIL